MNIFGIGSGEMVLLLVAALLIFGPGKLPEVAGQVGKAVRDFRRMTSDLTGEFEKTIAEASDIKDAFTSEVSGMRSQVSSVSESVKKDLTKPAASAATTSVKSSTSTVTSATTAPKEAVVATAPVASKSNPLAGISLLNDPPARAISEPAIDDDAEAQNPGDDDRSEGSVPAGVSSLDKPVLNDAFSRARQRRATAGYQQTRRTG